MKGGIEMRKSQLILIVLEKEEQNKHTPPSLFELQAS